MDNSTWTVCADHICLDNRFGSEESGGRVRFDKELDELVGSENSSLVLDTIRIIAEEYIFSSTESLCNRFTLAVDAFYKVLGEFKIEKLNPLHDLVTCFFQQAVGVAEAEQIKLEEKNKRALIGLVLEEEEYQTYQKPEIDLSHFQVTKLQPTNQSSVAFPIIIALGLLFLRSRLNDNPKWRSILLGSSVLAISHAAYSYLNRT